MIQNIHKVNNFLSQEICSQLHMTDITSLLIFYKFKYVIIIYGDSYHIWLMAYELCIDPTSMGQNTETLCLIMTQVFVFD